MNLSQSIFTVADEIAEDVKLGKKRRIAIVYDERENIARFLCEGSFHIAIAYKMLYEDDNGNSYSFRYENIPSEFIPSDRPQNTYEIYAKSGDCDGKIAIKKNHETLNNSHSETGFRLMTFFYFNNSPSDSKLEPMAAIIIYDSCQPDRVCFWLEDNTLITSSMCLVMDKLTGVK